MVKSEMDKFSGTEVVFSLISKSCEITTQLSGQNGETSQGATAIHDTNWHHCCSRERQRSNWKKMGGRHGGGRGRGNTEGTGAITGAVLTKESHTGI